MAVPEPLGLTRRTVLTGAAALLAAGTAGLTAPRPARAASFPQIRAAAVRTGRNGEILVLTADPATEADYTLRLLNTPEDPTSPAELGPLLPLRLRPDFQPHSMAAVGADLWITGAIETEPHNVRPALARIHESTAVYTEIPAPKTIRSGIATAIAPVGATGLAVVLEGGPGPQLTAFTHSHLLLSDDRGRTWTDRPLATGLGEGFGTVLTETDDGLFLAVADGEGTQTIHTTSSTVDRNRRSAPTRAAVLPNAGRPMAAIAAADHVIVFSDRDDTVAETRFTIEGTPVEPEPETTPECACQGEIHAVSGRRGTWLETDGSTIHIRTAG